MSTPRFYVEAGLRAGTSVTLPDEAAHHAVRVLRVRAGDAVALFDGRGGEHAGRVASIERLEVLVELLEYRPIERESPLQVILVQGVSSGERMDFTIRKAVELGVAEIQPVLAAASVARPKGERAAARREHWQKVVISACEQCGRNRLPGVRPLASVEDHLEMKANDAAESLKLLLAPRAGLRFSEACRGATPRITLAAGPEAGFTEVEEAAFLAAGFVPARLGPRVLRTETAALAALAALNALRGDF